MTRLERRVADPDFRIIIAESLIAFCVKTNQFRTGIFYLVSEEISIEIVTDIMACLRRMIIEKQNIFGFYH